MKSLLPHRMNPRTPIYRTPSIALVGLPNSGKSTLLNRLTGTRKAVTAKEAHTTRDLNYADTEWEGMELRFVDTGGLVPDPEDKIQKEIQIKTWSAVAEADILVWVIDRKQEPETIHDKIIQKVWKTGKPVIICINKIDNPNLDKNIGDYARLGGFDFVNVSATNSYGLNELLDSLVQKCIEIGFVKPERLDLQEFDEVKTKRVRTKNVHRDQDGKYYISREQKEDGPGLYQAIDLDEENSASTSGKAHFSWKNKPKQHEITNIVFDFFGVLFENNPHLFTDHLFALPGITEESQIEIQQLLDQYIAKMITKIGFFAQIQELVPLADLKTDQLDEMWRSSLGINQPVVEFLEAQKKLGKHIYYLTNINEQDFRIKSEAGFFDLFDGGVASYELDIVKPDPRIYLALMTKYKLDAANTLFIDDREENIISARLVGWWGITYRSGIDLELYVDRVEHGEAERIPEPPKILLLGKPNVGKSSLFNALTKQDLQIVTDIPGTTLSVNDLLLERIVKDPEHGQIKKQYVLLDSTGIRRPGQRTMGVESFATFRTIQTAYQADVVILVLDGSEPITHQDQVVAGVCREAKKGLVVVVNKADLVDGEARLKFIKDFKFKFKFLKVDSFVWVSAKTHSNLDKIWAAIDESIENREQQIDSTQLRRLFNYLMKQKPPSKLSIKKRPVIYDLLYTKSKPPTFELLLKDKTTIHWSYVRFLENIIRSQFDFRGTSIVVKLVEVDRKRVLT